MSWRRWILREEMPVKQMYPQPKLTIISFAPNRDTKFLHSVYISALKSRKDCAKCQKYIFFELFIWKCMITITRGGSRFRDTGRVPWRRVLEGTPSSKVRVKGFGGSSLTHILRKLRKDTQFWVNNEAKLTKNLRHAAIAIWCTNRVKNKVGQ